jgi:general stress protein CsbA
MYVIQSLRILLIDLIFIQNQEEYTESNSITFFSFVLVIVFQTITVFKYDNEKKLWTPTSPVCIF